MRQATNVYTFWPTPQASSSCAKMRGKPRSTELSGQWHKVHLGVDAQTLQIRAIAVITHEMGDSPMSADLLGQIASHEEIVSSTSDGA